MALQKAVKSYPLLRWALVLSAALVVLGVLRSGLVTDPDNARPTLLVGFLVAAAILPFASLLVARRQVVTVELPSDHLSAMGRQELEGVLGQLDAAKAKGEMDDARYTKARERVLAALKAKR